jgi:MFS family permease
VLAYTALSSCAAGTATLSIFFVTERAPYSFSSARQYALGLLVGVTYALGALVAGRVTRALARRGVSARALVAGITLALAALMVVPVARATPAALFGVLALYAPLTGFLWPLIEAYVSGGRRAGALRAAVGRFNIVWSATLLPSFLIPPLLEDHPARVFVAVAAAHLVSLLCLPFLRREPGVHAEEEAHAVPAEYRGLLRVHRVLHATSYLVMYALSPYLPGVLGRLGVDGPLRGALAATWLAARSVAFAVLERWHGWHGRAAVAVVGTALVLAGFAVTVLSPRLGAAGLPCLLVALVALGVGLAALYTAALYYAFEVAGHEGGGSHEALIGLGYSIGPSAGLAVCLLEEAGTFATERRDDVLLAVIAGLCLVGAALAWRSRKGAPERVSPGAPPPGAPSPRSS